MGELHAWVAFDLRSNPALTRVSPAPQEDLATRASQVCIPQRKHPPTWAFPPTRASQTYTRRRVHLSARAHASLHASEATKGPYLLSPVMINHLQLLVKS